MSQSGIGNGKIILLKSSSTNGPYCCISDEILNLKLSLYVVKCFKNPTITNIPKKSSYKPKAIESEGTVDSITTNEINEFLTTFFKLYPTATASELSYYVNDGILKPIGKEYIFQELVNPIHNRKDNQVTVSLTVEYIDQQTKATQVSQFDLVLEKNGSNWKIIE